MPRVLIFDTTLRDGEQSPGATMTTPEKLQMAHQLDRLGVDVLEAGFPISSPDEFNAVQRIGAEVRRPVIAALARATDADVERAAAALDRAARARLHVFLATSGIHLDHKLGISEDECIDRIGNAVTTARRYVDDVEFSTEDATRTDRAFLCRAVQTAVAAGATTINIPDTVGCTCPDEYRSIIETLLATVRGIEDVVLSVHCHNDLGLAVANSIAAVQAGARQIECTINGIGERAGNASMEEIVMAFAVRQDLLPFVTGVRTEEIYRSSQLLSSLTGIYPQPNKAIVGRNAFAHEAGIHQAGVIRHPSTYEIMRPEQVGVPESTLVLGKHSGRHAIGKRCRELGYELDEDALRRVYQRVIDIAEKKRHVLDEDLLAVLQTGGVTDNGQRFELVSLEVTCGGTRSFARVQLTDSVFPTQEAVAEGNGPLAAAFTSIDQLVDVDVVLEDMTIIPATSGGDAVGKVHLKASVEGKSFTGRGASTDIVLAAAQAYLHIINKAVQFGVARPHAFEFAHNFWGV
jgi:2-isopropylmalate synthase